MNFVAIHVQETDILIVIGRINTVSQRTHLTHMLLIQSDLQTRNDFIIQHISVGVIIKYDKNQYQHIIILTRKQIMFKPIVMVQIIQLLAQLLVSLLPRDVFIYLILTVTIHKEITEVEETIVDADMPVYQWLVKEIKEHNSINYFLSYII